MNTRTYAFLAAIAALLTSGVVYHALAEGTDQLDAAAARVALVPMDIGNWHGKDDASEAVAFEQTGAKGYWMRQYVNDKTGDSVLVILMCGRPGKMAVHTPEVCYRGAGYELHEQPAAVAIADNAMFWTAKFTKKTGHLRLAVPRRTVPVQAVRLPRQRRDRSDGRVFARARAGVAQHAVWSLMTR
jgi:Protein of unknown function (DUF3485)